MRRPTAKQAAKALDAEIAAAYARTCNRVEIRMLDIPKIYAAARAAHARGEDLDVAIPAFVVTIRTDA